MLIAKAGGTMKSASFFLFTVICCHGITSSEIKKIGQQIWKNEANNREDLLVFWSEHESFPSLGIGHNIWFPEGSTEPFTEQFPQLCSFLKKNGILLPLWLEKARLRGAPWSTRQEFLQDKEKIKELRTLLKNTIDLQTQFMLERLQKTLPKIYKKIKGHKLRTVKKNVELLQNTLLGNYALIDYLNFKGDGLNPMEVINGSGWGLYQVLLDMQDNLTNETVTKAFAVAASKRLITLVENSAPEYNRVKFLSMWIKRVNTYWDPRTFKV